MNPSQTPTPAEPMLPVAEATARLQQAAADHRLVRVDWLEADTAATQAPSTPGSDPLVVGAGCREARVVRPLGCFTWGGRPVLAAWCETQHEFRNVPLDRLLTLEVLDESFVDEPGRSLDDHRRVLQGSMDERDSATDA